MGDLHGERGSAAGRLRWAAARTATLLSALFLVVYPATNWITSQRGDVGTWYFSWELAIPFVPWLIAPYMSIDFFFVAAPFLCADRRELAILARRIIFAILAAATCFLLVPLRVAFEKPEVDGILGLIFRTFLDFDKPHNLVPSLHITLQMILLDVYARRTRGLLRGAIIVWFCLIGLSTVLTYQHHVMDVVGGLVLAAYCFYLFPRVTPALPVTKNYRVAGYYAFFCAVLIGLTVTTWPTGGWLLWPIVALGIVTAAYRGLGPGIYRKADGRLPLSTQLVLGPLLLGQQLSLLYYRFQCRRWDQVVPGVLIGRQLGNSHAADAVRQGVTAVLDLTAEFTEATPFRTVRYRNLPILDLTAPTPEQFRDAVTFITAEVARGTVYVHCKIGYSRSAAVVGAYLLASEQVATVEEAVAMLRKARPNIVVRPEAEAALREYSLSCGRTVYVSARSEAG